MKDSNGTHTNKYDHTTVVLLSWSCNPMGIHTAENVHTPVKVG